MTRRRAGEMRGDNQRICIHVFVQELPACLRRLFYVVTKARAPAGLQYLRAVVHHVAGENRMVRRRIAG